MDFTRFLSGGFHQTLDNISWDERYLLNPYDDDDDMQMRGGSIRYQAQNLRNVHIPARSSLSEIDVEKLVGAYESNDAEHLDAVVDAVVRDSTSRQPVRRY